MATQTKYLYRNPALDAQRNPVAAEVQVGYEYDDGTLRITRVFGSNPATSAWDVTFWFARLDGSRNIGTREAPRRLTPGQAQSVNVGQTAATRLQLTVTPSGRLDGLDGEVSYPVEPLA